MLQINVIDAYSPMEFEREEQRHGGDEETAAAIDKGCPHHPRNRSVRRGNTPTARACSSYRPLSQNPLIIYICSLIEIVVNFQQAISPNHF